MNQITLFFKGSFGKNVDVLLISIGIVANYSFTLLQIITLQIPRKADFLKIIHP